MRRVKTSAASMEMPRRQALRWSGGALLAATGATLLAGKAAAITLVEADEKTRALLHDACGPVAYHLRLAAEARAALESSGRPTSQAERAALDCPVCGCEVPLGNRQGGRPR